MMEPVAPPRVALVTMCVAVLMLAAGCGEDEKSDVAASSTTRGPGTASTATSVPEKELTAKSPVRLDGIGPIVMEMTLAEATAAVGRRVAVVLGSLTSGDDTDLCGFATVEGGPDGLSFMVNRDAPSDEWRIVRLDVADDGTMATGGGIRVGSTEEEVKRVYAEDVKTEPHAYTGPEGHYMVVDLDGRRGMKLLFETDGTRVLTYRSGLESAVDSPEGCA